MSPSLSFADLDELVRLWQSDNRDVDSELLRKEAIDEIWRRCAEAVRTAARRMAKLSPDRREQAEDLAQAGLAAAWEALHKFDPRRGGSLQSYLTFHARRAMGRCVADALHVRVTRHGRDLLRDRERAARELLSELGRPPTVEEVSRRMRELGAAEPEGGDATVAAALHAAGPVLSTDAPAGTQAADRSAYARWNSGESAGDPLSDVMRQDRCRVIREALDALGDEDQQLLFLRYFKEMPLFDIASALRISTAAVKMRLVRARRRFVERLPAGGF